MPPKQVATAQVVRKTIFDLKNFYITMHHFIKNDLGYSFSEDDYSQWVKDGGTDIEFHWTFLKEQEDYVHFRLWIECKVRGSTKVKSKVGEVTKTLDNAELEVNIKGVIITDPFGAWGKHPILKHIQKFYEKYMYKAQIDDYVERLWEHVFTLEGEIKAFFELPKFM